MNPSEIAEAMRSVLDTLDSLVDDTRAAGIELAECERKYKTRFAKARMWARTHWSKATVDAVNDHATIECEQELFDYEISKSTLTVCRESLRVNEAKLDALRSMSASIRGAGG